MKACFLERTGRLWTGLRLAVGVPVALVVAVLVMNLPVRDAPGFGGDSLACAVMMEVKAPSNWRLFVAVFAGTSALVAYGVDRFLARWVGAKGRLVSGALAAGVLVVVGSPLAMTEVGIFC